MVRKYEARGTELGGDAFYEDWVEVVRYEDYAELEAKLRFERETGASIVSIALERDKMMRRLAKLVLSHPCSTETEELAKDAIALFDLSD